MTTKNKQYYQKEYYKANRDIKKLEEEVKELKNHNDLMLRQQKKIKRYAEEQGTKKFEWKTKALRLEEEVEKLKTKIKMLKGD